MRFLCRGLGGLCGLVSGPRGVLGEILLLLLEKLPPLRVSFDFSARLDRVSPGLARRGRRFPPRLADLVDRPLRVGSRGRSNDIQ